MEGPVLREELVVHVSARRVRDVGRLLDPAHHGGSSGNVGVQPGGDRGVDGRPDRRRLVRGGDGDRAAQHVRVDLHQQPVALEPAGDDEFSDGHPCGLERLDDHPGAVGGGLDEGQVDLFWGGGEREPGNHPGEVVVYQDRPVAAHPVESDEAVRSHRPSLAPARQVLVQVLAALCGFLEVAAWDAEAGPPRENVAHGALPRLVAELPGDDPAVHHPADAWHRRELVAVHHVAGGGAHDREHLPGGDGPGGGGRDMRVDVARGHRDALGEAGERSTRSGQRAGPAAELGQRHAVELGLGEVGEGRVERLEVVRRRVVPVLINPLIAGRAGVSRLRPAELPDDPVGRLDPPLGPVVGVWVLFEQLQRLGELPLGGDPAAVPGDPRLLPCVGKVVDAVSLRLCRVVLPQLGPGMRPGAQRRDLAQRGPVAQHRQHGAGREIRAYAHHGRRVRPGVAQRGSDRGAERGPPVRWVLERPVGRECLPGGRERPLDRAVRVFADPGTKLRAVAGPHHDGTR